MPNARPLAPVLLLALLAGCSEPAPVAPAAMPPPAPVLIHLPGIGGELEIDRRLTAGLVAGGVAPEAQIVDWAGDKRGIVALGAIQFNRQQAKQLADKIVAIKRNDPRTPVILTGHSGGTGIAVWALEMLPDGVKIDTLVMLASALSPEYDLSGALRHVDRAISLHSKYDREVLGYGTRLLGTIDRVHTEAAGYVGFNTSAASDPEAYKKLDQVPYDEKWLRYGNFGDHIGPMDEEFAAKVLAGMIKPTRTPPGRGSQDR